MGETIQDGDNGLFSTEDDQGNVIGRPDSTADSADFGSFSWKEIEAAILGASINAQPAQANGIADPQSLEDAASATAFVQATLQRVAADLVTQARRLADGDDAPWKGPGAIAFLASMEHFSRQIQANADVLSGGSTGRHSVPNQLTQNAFSLADAQNRIRAIHVWFMAQAQGAAPSEFSSSTTNGSASAPIPFVWTNEEALARSPEAVNMMTASMFGVLQDLAGRYQVTVDAIMPPVRVDPPLAQPSLPSVSGDFGLDGQNGTTLGAGGEDFGTGAAPDFPSPSTLAAGPGGLGAIAPFPGNTGLSGGPDTNFAGSGGPGPSSIAPFPGMPGLGVGGVGGGVDDRAGVSRSLSPFPGGAGLGDISAPDMDSLLNPGAGVIAPFPGGTGLGGTARLPDTGGLPVVTPMPSLGALSDGPGAVKGRAGLPSKEIAGFPGGIGGLSDGPALPGRSESEVPGALEVESPNLGQVPDFDIASSGGVSDIPGNQGAGMPMMPMMPGVGSAGPASGDPSDSSGLLSPRAFPGHDGTVDGVPIDGITEDDLPEFTSPGIPSALDAAPLPGTENVTGFPGMPMMPSMGVGTNTASGESSDASGLLSREAKPWLGDPITSGEPEFGVTPPGGATLTPLMVVGSVGEQATDRRSGPVRQQVPISTDGVPEVEAAGTPGPVRANRVPVVHTDDTADDTAAWDVAAASFLPLLVPVDGLRQRARQARIDGVSTERAATRTGESEHPEPTRVTWRPDRGVAAGHAESAERTPRPGGIGPGDAALAPKRDAEPAPAEKTEKAGGATVVGHLLTQETSSWGGGTAAPNALE